MPELDELVHWADPAGQQRGPEPLANVAQRVAAGEIPPSTLVWWPTADGWTPLDQVLPPPPAPSPAPPAETSWSTPAAATYEAPSGAEMPSAEASPSQSWTASSENGGSVAHQPEPATVVFQPAQEPEPEPAPEPEPEARSPFEGFPPPPANYQGYSAPPASAESPTPSPASDAPADAWQPAPAATAQPDSAREELFRAQPEPQPEPAEPQPEPVRAEFEMPPADPAPAERASLEGVQFGQSPFAPGADVVIDRGAGAQFGTPSPFSQVAPADTEVQAQPEPEPEPEPEPAPQPAAATGPGAPDHAQIEEDFLGLVRRSVELHQEAARERALDELVLGGIIAAMLDRGFVMIDVSTAGAPPVGQTGGVVQVSADGAAHHDLRFEEPASGSRVTFALEHVDPRTTRSSGHRAAILVGYGERIPNFSEVGQALRQENASAFTAPPEPGSITFDAELATGYVTAQIDLLLDLDRYVSDEAAVDHDLLGRHVGAVVHTLRSFVRTRFAA